MNLSPKNIRPLSTACLLGLLSAPAFAADAGPALPALPAAPAETSLAFCNKLTGTWARAESDAGETFYPEISTTATDGCEVFTYSHFETALGRVTTFHFVKGVEVTDTHSGPNGVFDGQTALTEVLPEQSKLVGKGVHSQTIPGAGLMSAPYTLEIAYVAPKGEEKEALKFKLTVQFPDGERTMNASYTRTQ